MKNIRLTRPDLQALYEKVGGEEGLRQVLRLFYRRMSEDIWIGFFFDGRDVVSIADQQAGFLMRAMGITASYVGKAPADAHGEIPPILAGHFDRRLRILTEVLLEQGLEPTDIRTWLDFENAFRAGIVQEEGPVARRPGPPSSDPEN